MSDRTLFDALDLLRTAYPAEKVSLWLESRAPHQETRYTASVGGEGLGAESVYAWGDDPTQTAERLIDKAGDRDPEKMKQQRIDKLKAELAALEAAQPPAPQQLAELVQACEPEPTAA